MKCAKITINNVIYKTLKMLWDAWSDAPKSRSYGPGPTELIVGPCLNSSAGAPRPVTFT